MLVATGYPRRDAHRHDVIREILDHNGSRTHNRVGTDPDALDYCRSQTQMRECSQARSTTHGSIRCDVSIIADLYIVFDYGGRVYDRPCADRGFGINDCAGHDRGPRTKPSRSGYCRGGMDER